MVLWDYRDAFLSGLGVTLQLTVVAFVGAALLGTLMAAFRISPIAPLRGVGLVFVEVFRNVPLMSLMIVVVYALPEIGITMSFTTSVIVSMVCVGGAFLCEAVRGGINAVPPGQIEAARSLGFTFTGLLAHVVLPQALRIAVPPTVGFLVQVIKGTALASVIGFVELTKAGSMISNATYQPFLVYACVALLYFALCFPVSLVAQSLERKLHANRR